MPDAAPRPPQQLPGSRNDYAPISLAAVAAAALAFLFVGLLILIGAIAALTGKNLQEPWLLVFPILTVVLAFIARRQIRASEGARTGEYWANIGWTVAVIGGAVFVAYLFAIQYAVRREATAAFTSFTEPLAKSDPNNPLDADLAAAAFATLPPGQQSIVGKPTNAAAMQSTYQETVLRLRSSDLGRLVARNPGAVTVTAGTLVKWERKTSSIDSVMAGTVETPEGITTIAVPLIGLAPEGEVRRWYVAAPANGTYFAPGGRQLTRYGWAVELLGQTGKLAAQEFLALLQRPGMIEVVYEGFVKPGGDAKQAAERMNTFATGAVPRGSVAGTLAMISPSPAGMDAALDTLLTDATGNPRAGTDLERFRVLLATPGRIVPAGARFKENPDVLPLVSVTANSVEVAVPIEIVLATGGEQPPVARGRAILRLPEPQGPTLAAEITATKVKGAEATRVPPANLVEQLRNVKWRLVRLESDLTPILMPQSQSRGPPGGMMR